MGLRINTNIAAITGLRNLQQSARAQNRSLERLSTGLRINSGADDPSGLVQSERLRAQIKSLEQAQENTQRGQNRIRTADRALQEIQNLLSDINDSIIFALNDGGDGLDQIQAEQDSVDSAISAINRIANTTRFAGQPLLNGNVAYNVNSTVSDIINDLQIREMQFAQGVESQQISFDMTQDAQRGFLSVGSSVGSSENTVISGNVTLRVNGPRGTTDIVLAESATSGDVRDAVNNVSGETGVFGSLVHASATGGSQVMLLTEEFGAKQQVKLEVVDTTNNAAIQINGSTLAEGDIVADEGQNPKINVNGQSFTGNGRKFKIISSFANFEFELDSDTSIDGVFTPNIDATAFNSDSAGSLPGQGQFTVGDSGMQFQLRGRPRVTDRAFVGIEPVQSVTQGFEEIPDVVARSISGDSSVNKGGFLSSIKSGSDNDLITNPGNAQKIVDAAITQISRTRGHLGAVEAFTFEPNTDNLGVAIENLKEAESGIRDVNFAEASSEFAKNQVKFQAGTAVLASANTIPQSVLALLQ